MKYSYCVILLTISMTASFLMHAGNTPSTTKGKNDTTVTEEIVTDEGITITAIVRQIDFRVLEDPNDSSDDEKEQPTPVIEGYDREEEHRSKKSNSVKNQKLMKKFMDMKEWPMTSDFQ